MPCHAKRHTIEKRVLHEKSTASECVQVAT